MNTFTYGISDLKSIPARPARSNKGTFGRVLIVGGSVGMSGAAYFSAKAAYRTGAGLVQIMTPEPNRIIYQTSLPEALLAIYDPEEPDVAFIKNTVCLASCVAVGMGLGTSETSVKVLRAVLEAISVPLILDADALNILAADPSLWELVPSGTVITPHPAEMSRISSLTIDEICAHIPACATDFAASRGVI